MKTFINWIAKLVLTVIYKMKQKIIKLRRKLFLSVIYKLKQIICQLNRKYLQIETKLKLNLENIFWYLKQKL